MWLKLIDESLNPWLTIICDSLSSLDLADVAISSLLVQLCIDIALDLSLELVLLPLHLIPLIIISVTIAMLSENVVSKVFLLRLTSLQISLELPRCISHLLEFVHYQRQNQYEYEHHLCINSVHYCLLTFFLLSDLIICVQESLMIAPFSHHAAHR